MSLNEVVSDSSGFVLVSELFLYTKWHNRHETNNGYWMCRKIFWPSTKARKILVVASEAHEIFGATFSVFFSVCICCS